MLKKLRIPTLDDVNTIIETVKFNESGLITAIAQNKNKDILMLAWMNKEALRKTLLSGDVWYYSRSRNKLWRKGESSSQTQILLKASLDCDFDAIVLTVEQKGVPCHTGRKTCFFNEITSDGIKENVKPDISPEELYHKGE